MIIEDNFPKYLRWEKVYTDWDNYNELYIFIGDLWVEDSYAYNYVVQDVDGEYLLVENIKKNGIIREKTLKEKIVNLNKLFIKEVELLVEENK